MLEALNPSLYNDQITALERRYKVQLPQNIKLLYRWRNGQTADESVFFVSGYRFFTLEEMLLIRLDAEKNNYKLKQNQFPLFGTTTGFRSFICYDQDGLYNHHPGEIFCYNHNEPFDEDIAPSLESFISAINRYYENTPRKLMDEDFTIYFYGTKRTY
ncbi:MAG: benzoate transporter [Mucilaginibacter sp.]|nr:benzoate transporter [Mucilaginibacter sp.]